MEANANGIDVGGRALALLAAFMGESAEQNRAFFRIKGKKVFAAATAKDRSVEIEGKAEGQESDGEWPVDGSFIRKLSSLTVNGSKHVPAVVARLVLERTGVQMADLIVHGSGKQVDTLRHHEEMPQNKQLSFKTISATIDVDFANVGGSWYPLDKSTVRAVDAVLAATKGCPVSFAPGMDELSPVGFQSTGPDFVVRGILRPPAVTAAGRGATNAESDEDEDEGDERQPELPGVNASSDDDAIIDDDEADRIKASQKHPPLATEKRKAARRKQKNPKAGSR